jgi:ankyrin repeat protein
VADTEFAYDLLESEGRGVALDRRHVEHWLEGERKVGPKSLSQEPSDEFDPITPTESSPKSDEFQQAILKGDLALAQKLIDEDPMIVNSMSAAGQEQSNLSETALSVAVRIDKPSVIKFLLERGADPNLADSVDSLPIFSARDGEVAEALLKHGARWDVRDSGWGRTPLRRAAERGQADVVRALMRAGAPLDFESAAMLDRTDDMRRMLESEPWLVKLPSQSLHWAAYAGSKNAVEFLLDRGADINAGLAADGPWWGLTALSLAVSGGHFDVAKTLLERGASADVKVLVGNGTEPLSAYVRNRLDQKWQKLFAGRWADDDQNSSQ